MQQVGALLLDLIEVLGLSAVEARWIVLAGRLHDIGKLAIPENTLLKPGALSREEWALMRTHPIRGAEMVSRIPDLRPLAPLIRAHHERWDGHGYPDRLAGQEIPFGARLIAVVDAYLAMTEGRPYQQPRSRKMTLEELHRCAGTQFDPQLVAALARLMTSDLAREVT
jgi:HD-GYP domain-containing protein (c-di-GMP phosphodiesterase class II)